MRRALAAFWLLLPTAALAAEPGVTRFELPNGLTGVVIEDHRAPVVVQMVWYRVGSADDPAGHSGLAHFLEHLMFKGTRSAPDRDFSAEVARNGGNDNAFTTFDHTSYFQEIAADRLDLVMGMEADRMTGLALTEAKVLGERDVVRSERRQVVEGSPHGPFQEVQWATQFLNHPYGRPVIGWDHEIALLDMEAALAFYRQHYAPGNAILVVAGDVEPGAVEAMAARHFGPLPGDGPAPPRLRPQEPEQRAARRIEARDPRVVQPLLLRSWLAPARRPGDQREAAALAVLAGLLGGGATSEMTLGLQFGAEVAIATDADYDGVALDPTVFLVSLAPRDGVAPEAAEAELDRLLARVAAEGPDPVALARLKKRLAANQIHARDDLSGRAMRVGEALASGLTLEDVEAWPSALQAVTAAEVKAAAAKLFQPETSVTGWLLQASGEAEE